MRWLITGGSGFIGTNLAGHLVGRGDDVVVVDDLSRGGSELNAAFLRREHALEVNRIDVSDTAALGAFLAAQDSFDAIAHLAGCVQPHRRGSC